MLQTARYIKTEVQRETRKTKNSITKNKKRKMAWEEDAWTMAAELR
jgi:3-hydroxy-3-methylglutaryl CoA synthase